MKKSHKIIIILFIPFVILIIALSIITFLYFYNKKDETYNISNIEYKYLDMTNDFYHYDQVGYKTIIGVDLSEFNKDVDFLKLKEQGIEFAYLRLGWRGYANPQIHIDARFEEYYKLAKEANINIGVYFFSQAINEKEAIQEADFVINNLKDKNIDLYVAYDYESISGDTARTDDLSRKQRTLNARAFLQRIQEAGYKPIIYTNMYWVIHHYEYPLLLDYPIWFAQYSRSPQYKGNHIIWQYATEMYIDGISNQDGVDLNLMIIKEDIN